MAYSNRFAETAAPTRYVRVGVGGRWTAEDLQNCLSRVLASSPWQVRTRESVVVRRTQASPLVFDENLDSDTTPSLVEIVPLGDGTIDSPIADDEELDAVVISPLAGEWSGDHIRTARRHLARFVRQLKPGGATVFAADDPASDIFAAIRLDCRRLGYRSDMNLRPNYSLTIETGKSTKLRIDSPDDAGHAVDPGTAERIRLESAAMAVVQAFGFVAADLPGTVGAAAI